MLADEFAQRYRDGKATAKAWFRTLSPPPVLAPGRTGRVNTLENFMNLIGYELPEDELRSWSHR